jgi:hypothetical protein
VASAALANSQHAAGQRSYHVARLASRGVISLAGPECVPFLQVSNCSNSNRKQQQQLVDSCIMPVLGCGLCNDTCCIPGVHLCWPEYGHVLAFINFLAETRAASQGYICVGLSTAMCLLSSTFLQKFDMSDRHCPQAQHVLVLPHSSLTCLVLAGHDHKRCATIGTARCAANLPCSCSSESGASVTPNLQPNVCSCCAAAQLVCCIARTFAAWFDGGVQQPSALSVHHHPYMRCSQVLVQCTPCC